MNKIYRGFLLALVLGLATLSSTQPAYAQLPTSAKTTSVSSWLTIVPHDCQDADGCDICEVTKVFTNAANLIASLLSGLALLMFILGGMFMLFSAGNESRVETGKKILIGTVTGIAIIFVAWLAVSIIVRTTALSGGKADYQVFGKDWWSMEGCYPALLSTCKGSYVGQACGFNECGAGTTKNPICSCYRYIEAGEGTSCDGDDVSNITSVQKDAKNPNKSCGCFASCTALAGQTKLPYTCTVSPETITTANAAAKAAGKAPVYTVRTDVSCADTSKVCSLAN